MILIIGGAYQGKLDYAKRTYNIPETDIFHCSAAEIDFSKDCIYAIEEFCYACIREDREPGEYFKAHAEQWKDSILICQDIFCGVVPMDAQLRRWRQETGRLCQYLSGEAEQVVRIFCGLEQRLK